MYGMGSRSMNKTCSSGDRTRNKRVLYAVLEVRFERTRLHWAADQPRFGVVVRQMQENGVGLMSALHAARWLKEDATAARVGRRALYSRSGWTGDATRESSVSDGPQLAEVAFLGAVAGWVPRGGAV